MTLEVPRTSSLLVLLSFFLIERCGLLFGFLCELLGLDNLQIHTGIFQFSHEVLGKLDVLFCVFREDVNFIEVH